MNRRSAALGAALALSLSVSSVLATGAVTAPSQAATSDSSADDAAQALSQLRQDANGPVKVARDDDGTVTSLSSTNGSAMLDSDASTPAGAVKDTLADYGDAIGIDGDSSKAVVTKTLDSSTGGSVVRAQQTVDGVPVFGGQVVVSLDPDNDVVSVAADTSEATSVAPTEVPQAKAQATAVAEVAKIHRVAASSLQATPVGRRLYDPALAHTFDPRGARPVWQFQVSNGSAIRETVLVGTARGEVAFHVNDAPDLSRIVCDNNNARTISEDDANGVPLCTSPARSEGDAPVSSADVNAAYDNLGLVDTAYQQLDGVDLTDLIGVYADDGDGPPSLMATVRWCYTQDPNDPTPGCPYRNAFWDGQQMVFGQGYAGADDVVGHELTHGYVDNTAGLISFDQTGAINESVADTIGEVIDHRDVGDDDASWTIGESLPGGALRSMKNPTQSFQGEPGQPDRMRSTLYQTPDFNDGDSGAVHQDDGVGNKTAYLISQGGTFNGQTITGIDAGDPGLSKTGRLYLETIPRLGQFAQWADLGRTLGTTCDELALAGTGGFSTSDCASVRSAVTATELAQDPLPGRAAPNAPVTCPTRYWHQEVDATDDDDTQQFPTSFGSLWQRTPDNDTPTWASSGTSSWFGFDPDPAAFGDPTTSDAILGPFSPTPLKGAVLSFHHAYLFDYAPAGGGLPAEYFDGAQVFVQTSPDGSTGWTTVNSLPWVNGPSKVIDGSSTKGFGGDSHGYGTSSVDLSSLAGEYVRVLFRVRGDSEGSLLGWFVDQIRLDSCESRVPTIPMNGYAVLSGTKVTLAWDPPITVGSGVTSYQVVESGRVLKTVPATVRRTTVTTPTTTRGTNFTLRALNVYGEHGRYDGGGFKFFPSRASVTAAAKVKKNKPFVVLGTASASDGRLRGVSMTLQRKGAKSRTWVNVARGITAANGTKSWVVRQKKSTYYRVVTWGARLNFGTTSPARLVKKK